MQAGAANEGGNGRAAGDAGAAGTGGEGGEGGDTGPDTTPPAILQLTIEPNPNMTISCFVTWRTRNAASSEVDFGAESYAFRIRDDALVTDHRMLVIGMHADTSYKIKAISSNMYGVRSAEGNFTTGPLPEGIPIPSLTASDMAHAQLGWTLTNIEVGMTLPARIVMYDEIGLPVWYFINGQNVDDRGDIAAELVDGQVLVGPAPREPPRVVDLSGDVLWEGALSTPTRQQSHVFGKTPTGNYLLNIDVPPDGTSPPPQRVDEIIQEITPALDVVWSWQLFEHVPKAGSRYEPCHGNALEVNELENAMYYNCRFLGIFKIDRASGDVAWRLGGTYDTVSYGPGDFTFDPPESQFSDAHDPEYHPDGTVLVYDNGGYANVPVGTYHSRVVEYQLDQTKKTATRTFEFPGALPDVPSWYKSEWYTPIWGDSDRLTNGNILVTAGMRSATLSTRIFEITPSGSVVWEITFEPNHGSYRAQRLSPPPLVEPLD